MSLQRRILAIKLISILLVNLVLAQSDVQPMPEPTTVYTCGDDFQPVDLLFDSKGYLYSTSPHLTEMGGIQSIPYTLEFQPFNLALGSVYKHENDRCEVFADKIFRPFGLSDFGEDLCFNYTKLNETNFAGHILRCYDDGNYVEQPLNSYSVMNDLLTSKQNTWVAFGGALDIESLFGFLVNQHSRAIIQLPSVPHFIARLDNDKMLVSHFGYSTIALTPLSDKSTLVGATSNGITIVNINDGSTKSFTQNMVMPSGVVAIEGKVWVADYREGSLRKLKNTGEVEVMYTGLQGPMGMEQAPNGDLCIAEMLGGRISCYSLASLGLE